MYPTLFRIPFLPDWLADIKAYGIMMMIAFLSGIWLACDVRKVIKLAAASLLSQSLVIAKLCEPDQPVRLPPDPIGASATPTSPPILLSLPLK